MSVCWGTAVVAVTPAARREMPGGSTYPLRVARLARGLSAPELAGRLGVHPQTVIRWERFDRFPGPLHLAALADALDVPRQVVLDVLAPHRPSNPVDDGYRGAGLRVLRRRQGVPVRLIAADVGVTESTVYNWEHDRVRLPRQRLPLLAECLGLSVPEVTAFLRQHRGPVQIKHRRPLRPLGRIRHRAGFTVREAARLAGIPRQRLAQLESGHPFTRRSEVLGLARTYRRSPAALLRIHPVEEPLLLDRGSWAGVDPGRLLRALRRWSGETQASLATALGCSTAAVRSWERGAVVPPPRRRRQLEGHWRLPDGALEPRHQGSAPVRAAVERRTGAMSLR